MAAQILSGFALIIHTIGRLLRGMFGLSWRIVGLVTGSLLIIVGMLLGLVLVGGICGFPLIIVGLVIVTRSLF